MRKADILIYFYGSVNEVYQIEQWQKVFEALHAVSPIQIIVRSRAVATYLASKTTIPVNYINDIDTLLSYYEQNDPKVILYVNNGAKNFQSLVFHRALHIHLNHGESEKSSMYSNQCKAYDYTYVVGDAAIDRYKKHMIHIEAAHYVKIGRPQYDHIAPVERFSKKTTILYAPTDESTHESMRYSSLEKYGLEIVNEILDRDDLFFVYRPHPSTGAHSKKVKKINQKIIDTVHAHKNGNVALEMNALDLLSVVDLAIFDNSSLIIDYLYFDRPMCVTDMFNPKYHDKGAFQMIEACTLLDDHTIQNLTSLIDFELKNDTLKEKRGAIKEYYLGNYTKGESTQHFIDRVIAAMQERDALLHEKNMLETIH